MPFFVTTVYCGLESCFIADAPSPDLARLIKVMQVGRTLCTLGWQMQFDQNQGVPLQKYIHCHLYPKIHDI